MKWNVMEWKHWFVSVEIRLWLIEWIQKRLLNSLSVNLEPNLARIRSRVGSNSTLEGFASDALWHFYAIDFHLTLRSRSTAKKKKNAKSMNSTAQCPHVPQCRLRNERKELVLFQQMIFGFVWPPSIERIAFEPFNNVNHFILLKMLWMILIWLFFHWFSIIFNYF